MTQEMPTSVTTTGTAHEGGASQVGGPPGSPQRKRWQVILDIGLDAGVPTGCYWLSMAFISHSEVIAILVASIFPTLKSVYGLLRRRTLDPISAVILLGLVVGLAVLFLGGGPKLLLIRESLFTAFFGLACLISLLCRRPLFFFFGRYAAAGSDPARLAWYDGLWQQAGFRRMYRIITLVWGLVLVGEFALRLVLIYTVSPAMVLAISPVVLGGVSLLAGLWTAKSAARSGKALAPARTSAPIQGV